MSFTENQMDEAAYRAAVYGMFAKALRPPVEEDEAWVHGDLLVALGELRELLGSDSSAPLDPGAIEPRQREFTRLFEAHGAMAAPPFETEYIKDWPQQSLIQASILADVQGFYKAFGLEISVSSTERCDHIRLELEFLHFLGVKETIALDRQEEEHWEIVRDAQKKFLEDHVQRWPVKFLQRLKESKALSFYVEIAELLALWIEEDMKTLGCAAAVPCESPHGVRG